jgi:hypothetical protein
MDRDAFLRRISECLQTADARLGVCVFVGSDGTTKGVIASFGDVPTPLHPLFVLGAVTQQAHALIAASVREVRVEGETDDDVN